MIRCVKTSFKTGSDNLDRLFQCYRLSAQMWNECLSMSKAFTLSHGGKWIGKSQLQEELKGKYPMHSQSIQAVAHKYLFARDAAYKANQKGYKNKYPWRRKENFNTKWVDKAFRIEGGNLYLSMRIENGKKRTPIKLKIAKLPSYPINEIELIYDRKLSLAFPMMMASNLQKIIIPINAQ